MAQAFIKLKLIEYQHQIDNTTRNKPQVRYKKSDSIKFEVSTILIIQNL
jgi:hypothetical protein